MAEPKLNTRYQCRRSGMITFEESVNHALMCKIPYESFDEDPIAGTHSVCIFQKDGTPQELTIRNLMEIFKVNSLIDITKIPLPENPTHEFDLSDWEAKEKYPGFRWINPPREAQDMSTIEEKWGGKLALFSKGSNIATPSKPEKKAVAEKPAEEKKVTSSRKVPTKKTEVRKSSAEEVMELLVKKHYPDGNATDDQQQELGDKYYFPAQDELFGKNVSAETPEQWGQVADKLGL